ncbi:hypothetical protein M569_02071, partial [Genlisea aurea]
ILMDRGESSEALNTLTSSAAAKGLNAEAPEFVPRSSSSSSAAATTPSAQLLPQAALYARPPSFIRPLVPAYYGYENYFPQKVVPFYGYNVSPLSQRDFSVDGSNSPAAPVRNGLTDAHQKVINQVEFYFSDINLATTDQLFRFMCKDPEGYAPISVVASFKKIKNAISDSSQLASVLRNSNKLIVSEDGKKVKRQQPLTESDMEELQARIIVAENLPEDHSHQNLLKIFSSVGSVKSIRTCPPQSWNGVSSASKTPKGDGLNLNGKLHTFVEYKSAEEAEKAVMELNDDGNWRNGLKVRLLLKSGVCVKNNQTRTEKVAI